MFSSSRGESGGVVNSIFLYIVGMYVAKVLFKCDFNPLSDLLAGCGHVRRYITMTVPSLTEGILQAFGRVLVYPGISCAVSTWKGSTELAWGISV